MMTKPEPVQEDDMRAEYGPEVFARGVRGKYLDRYQQGTNVALLAPHVRAAFPTDEATNEVSEQGHFVWRLLKL